MRNSDDYKREVQRLWDADPCGAICEFEPGTRDFFDAVEKYRYCDYAPWMKKAFNFGRYKGKKVLEVGFGLGTDLMQFARAGADVNGIDITRTHYELTRKRFELYGFKADLRLGDAENMPFQDNSFDVVYSFGVLHHTPDTNRAIDEIYRILKPGGEAVISLYHKNSAHYWLANVIYKGVIRGRLLIERIDDILVEMECGTHSDAKPLVKVYTKKEAREMFKKYSTVNIDIYHLRRSDCRVSGIFVPIHQSILDTLSKYFGWYVVIHAIK